MQYDDLFAMWNDDHRGRVFLLSPEYDYLNLMDYDAKYAVYHSLPSKSTLGKSSFQTWRDELIGKNWNSDSSSFPNLPGLHLIDLSSKYQFLTSSDTNERYGSWTEGIEEYAHRMYCIYEDYFNLVLCRQMGNDVAVLLKNRVRVFQILEMWRYGRVAAQFLYRVLFDMNRNAVMSDEIIVDLMKATCVTQQMKVFLFSQPLIRMDEWRSLSITGIFKAARRAGFDFWGAWSIDLRNKYPLDRFCPLTQAFFSGNKKMMDILLQFGFTFDLRPVLEEISVDFFMSHFGIDGSLANLPGTINHRTVLMCVLFQFVHHSTLSHLWQIERLNDDFQIPFMSSNVPPEVLQKCLATFWRAYPGPFMSRAEFMQLAYDLFRVHHSYLAYAECVYNVNATLSPEHFKNGPRSLLHMSRCALRKQLHKSCTMPEGIWQLEIPTNLRSYLMLKW